MISKTYKIMAMATVAIAAVCAAPRATNAAPALYDDFEAATIDRTKWAGLEFVRRVENGVLKSELTRFGSDESNNLTYAGPDTVSSFQAEVTVTAVSTTAARARARLFSHFYNDGTPGGGEIGDVFANIEIRDTGAGLHVVFNVKRCTNPDCSIYSSLISDDTTFGSVNLDEPHILSLAWDGAQFFTFGFDNETPVQLDPTAMAPVAGPSKVARTVIRTRIDQIDGPEEGGAISVTYDDVMVNGLPYDDFSTALIDRAKWDQLEVVRQISTGKFKSELTSFGSNRDNNLNFPDPAAVNAYQAEVTVTEVINIGANPRARLAGFFFNDGAPGVDQAGEVQGEIHISHIGTGYEVAFFVVRCVDDSCSDFHFHIFDSTRFGPVSLGETHTLSIAFDLAGKKFIFGFDGDTQEVPIPESFVAAANIRPSQYTARTGLKFKGIGTRVTKTSGDPNNGAHIAATFDNVKLIGLTPSLAGVLLLLLDD